MDPLDKFTIQLDPVKDADKEQGDKVIVNSKLFVNEQGFNEDFTGQLTSVAERKLEEKNKAELTKLPFSGRYGFVAPTGTSDYNAASQSERDLYCFMGPRFGDFAAPNFGKPYKVI